MGAYRICEEYGAALDPGERCDCQPTAPLRLIKPESDRLGTSCEGCTAAEDPSECCGACGLRVGEYCPIFDDGEYCPIFDDKENADTSGTGGGA